MKNIIKGDTVDNFKLIKVLLVVFIALMSVSLFASVVELYMVLKK